MPTPTFPLPVSLFSRDMVNVCSRALEEAWLLLGREREGFVMAPDIVRLNLAHGIVLAVVIGVRDHRRLVKAGLEHLDQVTERCLPPLEPLASEETRQWKDPTRFRYRAEEVRVSATEMTNSECRAALEGVAAEYERMARSAERIQASRKALNALPPLRPDQRG